MFIENQNNSFHAYHNRSKITAVTFQCKLFLGIYNSAPPLRISRNSNCHRKNPIYLKRFYLFSIHPGVFRKSEIFNTLEKTYTVHFSTTNVNIHLHHCC